MVRLTLPLPSLALPYFYLQGQQNIFNNFIFQCTFQEFCFHFTFVLDREQLKLIARQFWQLERGNVFETNKPLFCHCTVWIVCDGLHALQNLVLQIPKTSQEQSHNDVAYHALKIKLNKKPSPKNPNPRNKTNQPTRKTK